MNKELHDELIAMQDEDQRVRKELAESGELWEGYHPRNLEVHERNGKRLEEILDEHGWPGVGLVGEDGTHAAFLVAHHNLSNPNLQRKALKFMTIAANNGEVPKLHMAMLTDRIRFNEGKPQVYGTMFDWNEQGIMDVYVIENIEHVDARRKEVGLPPLEEDLRERQNRTAQSGERPPSDLAERNATMEKWYKSVGWRN